VTTPKTRNKRPIIARLDLAAIDELKEALPHFSYRPLPHLAYLKREQIEGYWLDDIASELADERSTGFASRAADRIKGLVLYSDSPWDTKVIGEPVAIIKYLVGTDDTQESRVLDDLLTEVLEHAANRGIHCLMCKVQPLQFGAIHALERYGFLLMDTLLDFLFDFSGASFEKISPPQPLNGLRLRLANPEDLSELLALTEEAFANHFGRYNADPKLRPGTGTKVYQEWVRSSFSGAADWILIAEVDDKIAGYSVWKKASALETKHSFDIVHCTLAGIHPNFFGRGLYTTLTFEGMRMAHKFASHLDGPAHVSHYPVHRAMLKLGWKIAGVRHSFHKWLKP
jgi:RimJ/RimL family protein N-acetyltransferase